MQKKINVVIIPEGMCERLKAIARQQTKTLMRPLKWTDIVRETLTEKWGKNKC